MSVVETNGTRQKGNISWQVKDIQNNNIIVQFSIRLIQFVEIFNNKKNVFERFLFIRIINNIQSQVLGLLVTKNKVFSKTKWGPLCPPPCPTLRPPFFCLFFVSEKNEKFLELPEMARKMIEFPPQDSCTKKCPLILMGACAKTRERGPPFELVEILFLSFRRRYFSPRRSYRGSFLKKMKSA